MRHYLISSLLVATILSACGGGGGGGGSSQQVGQFIDDPVGGLTYSCISTGSSQPITGTTDADGHFNYLPGQTCTFKVGNVTLGSLSGIPTDGKVTPQDVAGVSRSATAAPSAVAIAQFLQSLNDGTSSGKIVIPAATTTALSANSVAAVTLVSSTGSVSQSDLQTVVTAAGKTLVSPSAAKGALDTQIASGAVDITSGSVSANAPVVLNSISVTSNTNNQPAGLTAQLTATGYYSDGSTADLSNTVNWTSSDTSTLTVSNAVATGKKIGNATITASLTSSGSSTAIKGSMLISTAAPVMASIAISSSNSLPAGLTDQLAVTGTLTDGSTTDVSSSVTWLSSDTSKATVSSTGLVTGLVKGASTITASYGTGTVITGAFIENVLDPNIVNLVISYVQSAITTVQNTASAALQAFLNFTDKTSQAVTASVKWSVSPANYVTFTTSLINNTASLIGNTLGSANITAIYTDLKNQLYNSNALNITVTALPPTVQNTSATLNVAGVFASTVTGSVTATDPQGLTLSYSVSSNGAVGTATINSTNGAFSYTVSGNTTATTDTFNVSVSNGQLSSTSVVTVTLNTDPLLQNQWHIQNLGLTAFASVLPTAGNDMNVAAAWALGYTGKGVKIAVVDTGLEIAHEDLSANIDIANSRNLVTNTTNPTPTVSGEDHGTQVAGIIGAVPFNGKGGRGVAHGSRIRGYNYLASNQSLTNLGNALGLASYSSDNDIFNESFAQSPTNLDPVSSSYSSINTNLLTMRNGKGAILIQSAGNEFSSFNDGSTVCNNAIKYGVSCGDPATDTRRDGTLPIIVGAINADGVKSSYSNSGTAIWVVAPGGEFGKDSNYQPTTGSWYNSLAAWVKSFVYKPAITTTAFTGCSNALNGTTKVNSLDSQGQNTNAKQCQYTALMNGTSSAAPNLSGVVALMLEANPNLGYRDVRHILAKTAKKVDATNTGVTSTNVISGSTASVVLDQGWVKNSAGNWFSNSYGFGAVDAGAAVAMSKSYSNYLSSQQSASLTMHYTAGVNVPNGNTTGSTMTFNMSPSFSTVEQVITYINITSSPALSCNQIELTSPSGTKSILMHAGNGFSNNGVYQTSIPGTRFMSNAFYGESGTGTWTLRFLDFCNFVSRTTILSTDMQTLSVMGH